MVENEHTCGGRKVIDIYVEEGGNSALALTLKKGEVGRREFDLIEFYKKVKEKHHVLTVEFDEENHIVSFGVTEDGFE